MARVYVQTPACPCAYCRANRVTPAASLLPHTRAGQALAGIVFGLALIGAADVVKVIL